nr:MAG TPA: hypothetical protein [Caudoviricetes sp.]
MILPFKASLSGRGGAVRRRRELLSGQASPTVRIRFPCDDLYPSIEHISRLLTFNLIS